MAVDVVAPISTSARGNNFILVMNEYLARYMIAAPMPDQKAETVKNTFSDSVILEYGVPERVLTDQGTNFLSQTMDTLYKQLGIERLRTTAYRPCCYGMVERFNRTMTDIIASYVINQPNTWDNYIKYATFA
jgi:transposase InsO family protein